MQNVIAHLPVYSNLYETYNIGSRVVLNRNKFFYFKG